MIHVTCNHCKNYDLFGTMQYTGNPGKLRKEIARFYKIPVEAVSESGKTIQYCRYCNSDTETEYNLLHNVDSKRTAAINKKKGLGMRCFSLGSFQKKKKEKKNAKPQ